MSAVIILARGGSKRIPRKNLINFCGKPLLQWSIENGLEASDSVYVSSEDDEILDLASRLGAIAVPRPMQLAEDSSSSESAISDWYNIFLSEKERQKVGKYYILLQPTSPLLKSKYIVQGIELFLKKKADCVFSACQANGVYHDGDYYIKFSRKHPQSFIQQNGAFYIAKTDNIEQPLTNGYILPLMMPRKYSIDIDTLEDLDFAKLVKCGLEHKC